MTMMTALPVFLTACFVAACSTVLILRAVVRRSRTGRLVVPPVHVPAVSVSGSAEGELAAPPDAPADDDEDAFYGVGKDLRSAREEFALAMRLHSGSMGDGSRRSARSACRVDATNAERVRVAKRLGIGRGEIDLALRLQKLEIRPVEGETA